MVDLCSRKSHSHRRNERWSSKKYNKSHSVSQSLLNASPLSDSWMSQGSSFLGAALSSSFTLVGKIGLAVRAVLGDLVLFWFEFLKCFSKAWTEFQKLFVSNVDSPLMTAILLGHSETVGLLLKAGANIHEKNAVCFGIVTIEIGILSVQVFIYSVMNIHSCYISHLD